MSDFIYIHFYFLVFYYYIYIYGENIFINDQLVCMVGERKRVTIIGLLSIIGSSKSQKNVKNDNLMPLKVTKFAIISLFQEKYDKNDYSKWINSLTCSSI